MKPDPVLERETTEILSTLFPVCQLYKTHEDKQDYYLRTLWTFARLGHQRCPLENVQALFDGLAESILLVLGGECPPEPLNEVPAYRWGWAWSPWPSRTCLEASRRIALRIGGLDPGVKGRLDHLLGVLAQIPEEE